MHDMRSSGILLHPSSLPGRFGVGDLGAEAFKFVDFLSGARQKYWQVLPLGPCGFGDSPYQCFSSFAGNPLLISIEQLAEAGWLAPADVRKAPRVAEGRADFGRAAEIKFALLRESFRRFEERATKEAKQRFKAFCKAKASWLDDYALFMALKGANGGGSWTDWPKALARRDSKALKKAKKDLAAKIDAQCYFQFVFFSQWGALKQHCQARHVEIIGDVPIYVAHDSADVWSHPDYFHLTPDGEPTVVAGVPPDYFCAEGQRWGNPLYRWDVLKSTGFAWWIERFKATLELVDLVRLDHFRGFEAYWEVPADAPTARTGRWVLGPGAPLFKALQRALGGLPFIAENLGVITPQVEALREQFSLPGMKVLQFAFGSDERPNGFLPHNYVPDVAAYTGTHDNDTTVGWWTTGGAGSSTVTQAEADRQRDRAERYLNVAGRLVHWVFIRAVFASVAKLAIVPLQDVLGLGTEARMNHPGIGEGNWRWRFPPGALTLELEQQLGEITALYERA